MNICLIANLEKPYLLQSIKIIEKIATKIDIYDSSKTDSFPKELYIL